MIRKIIFLVCFVALIFFGRKVIKFFPEADRAVTSMTKETCEFWRSGWKSTKQFYKKNVNHRKIDKNLEKAKAPFIKYMKKRKKEKAAANRPKRNNFTIATGAPPETVTAAVQN